MWWERGITGIFKLEFKTVRMFWILESVSHQRASIHKDVDVHVSVVDNNMDACTMSLSTVRRTSFTTQREFLTARDTDQWPLQAAARHKENAGRHGKYNFSRFFIETTCRQGMNKQACNDLAPAHSTCIQAGNNSCSFVTTTMGDDDQDAPEMGTRHNNDDASVKTPYAIGMAQAALTDHDCGDAAPSREGVYLYHFAESSCSQKVRMSLAYKGVSVQYHHVLLNLNDQHLPQYVRINPRCVVPSLVINGKVTTDSRNILEHLDGYFPNDRNLIPLDEKERTLCLYWTKVADELPIHLATFGELDGVQKPLLLRILLKDHDDDIVKTLEDLIERHKNDNYLKNAYEGKLRVIRKYSESIHTPADMKAATDLIDKSITELNEQLANGPFASNDGFLCSQDLCVADIEWCVLLKRLEFVGGGSRWLKDTPTGAYFEKLTTLECYKDGIAKFDNKAKLAWEVAGRKFSAAIGKETVL